MPKPASRTFDPPSPSGHEPASAGLEPALEPARRAAISALLHRLNGGLNNAALAFELALSRSDNAGAESEHMLDRGLAGVAQASRAATLLALMVDPTAAPPASAARPYAQDVVDILRAHARRTGTSLETDFDLTPLAGNDITPTATVEALLAGLAALDRAATR